jgi:iron complex outermembrane receptor protein
MSKQRNLFRSSLLAKSIRASQSQTSMHVSTGVLALALSAGMINVAFGQEKLEEIQITGSRVTRTTMDTPTPVTTITADELSNMAPGSLIDALVQMPQYYNNQIPNQENGGQNSGGANINLRGAGANRTLVLLDGRRVVPTNRFGSVDVNSIPEDLLKTVETVTGGASASYGTDAVAGVVNFILDTKFEGFKTHAQTGITELGDGKNWEVGAAFGRQFSNGIHIIGSASMADQAGIASFDSLKDRPFIARQSRVTNPDPNGPTDLVRSNVFPTNYTNGGILTDAVATSPLNRMAFNPDGTVSPLNVTGLGAVSTGCQCIASPTTNYGVNADEEVMNGYRRYNSFLHGDYDVNDHMTAFAQVMYARNFTSDRWQSIPLLSIWAGRVYAENPFLQPSVANLIIANKPANAQYETFGFFAPNTPDSVIGESRENTLNHMYSTTVGVKGDFDTSGFFKDWKYNAYYQYGANTQDFIETNGTRVDRLFLAMDAVTGPAGTPICRVNLPQFTGSIASGGNGGLFSDCVPINLFGGVQHVSKAAADYVMDRNSKDARQWTNQSVWEFVLNGDIYKGFGAGPVGSAFGASYRQERLDQRTTNPADEFPAQVNGTLLSDQGLMPAGIRGLLPQGSTAVAGYNGIAGLRYVPAGFTGDSNSSSVLFSSLRAISGSYNVKEAFGELNIPLVKNIAVAQYIELDASARWADYSGSGAIWAGKVGLNWTINDQVRLRATQSRDVRAASLRERLDQTRGGITVTNPWQNNVVVSAASFSGGNPNVNPEKADTTTAGLVYRPSWMEGLSVSVDYYYIDINDAIAQLTAQNIVNSCRTGDLTLCQYVISGTSGVTDPLSNTPRSIDRVDALFINLANQRISGTDVEATYKTDVKWIGGAAESLTVRMLYSNLAENSIQNKGAIRDDRAGQIGAFGFAKNKLNLSFNYKYDTFMAFLSARWMDGGLLDRTVLESQVPVPLSLRPAGSLLLSSGTNIYTIENNHIPSITYVDLKVSKTFGKDNKLEVFGNVNNLLNRDPLATPTTIGRAGTGGAINTSLYDVYGRRYTVGVNYVF